MNKIKAFIKRHRVLLLLILLALLLRIPWLYTTIEKDEGTFGYFAWRMLEGDKIHFGEITDNKPPLIYVLYAIPLFFFGNSIIPVRLFNSFLFVISVIFFFKLVEHFFKKRVALFSTLFYIVFMNIPVFEGFLAMTESFLTPFLILSVYFFQKYICSKKAYILLISLVFASITVLIKQQAIFICPLLFIGVFIYKEKYKIKTVLFTFFLLMPVWIILFLINKEIFLSLLQKTWAQLIESDMGFSSGYMPLGYNLLIILEGSVLWLFSLIGIIKILKSRLNHDSFFILSWCFLALAFTIIPPAYGHYYLFLVPPLAIFAGIGTTYAIESKQNKKVFIFLVMILVLLISALIIKHYPDSTLNLGPLHWGLSSFKNYQQQVLLNEYIKNVTSSEDKILVWGWEPGVYWLSERIPGSNTSNLDCGTLSSGVTLEQVEKDTYQRDVKLIVFLPGYERRCENMTQEVFSNPPLEYYETEFNGIKMLYKK